MSATAELAERLSRELTEATARAEAAEAERDRAREEVAALRGAAQELLTQHERWAIGCTPEETHPKTHGAPQRSCPGCIAFERLRATLAHWRAALSPPSPAKEPGHGEG